MAVYFQGKFMEEVSWGQRINTYVMVLHAAELPSAVVAPFFCLSTGIKHECIVFCKPLNFCSSGK